MRVRSAVVCLFLVLVACQRGGDQSVDDPDYGKDTCAQCGSIVQDPKFAALSQSSDGKRNVFDDPGCLFVWLRAAAGHSTTTLFHEHAGARWLEPDEVSFAKTPATKSPQGYGWAAYGSFGDAQTAVTSAGAGEILSFSQAKEIIGARSP